MQKYIFKDLFIVLERQSRKEKGLGQSKQLPTAGRGQAGAKRSGSLPSCAAWLAPAQIPGAGSRTAGTQASTPVCVAPVTVGGSNLCAVTVLALQEKV